MAGHPVRTGEEGSITGTRPLCFVGRPGEAARSFLGAFLFCFFATIFFGMSSSMEHNRELRRPLAETGSVLI